MPEEDRFKLYHMLTTSYDKFPAKGEVFLLGDSNARLGNFLNDFNIHGKPISNKNTPLLLGF